MSPKLTVEDEEDAWRLVCPNGHQVTPTNNHFYCHQCARVWDDEVDSEFDEVEDRKTGETLTREDVAFDFDTPGVHYA